MRLRQRLGTAAAIMYQVRPSSVSCEVRSLYAPPASARWLRSGRVVDFSHQLPRGHGERGAIERHGEFAAEARGQVAAHIEAGLLAGVGEGFVGRRRRALRERQGLIHNVGRILHHESGDQRGVRRDVIERAMGEGSASHAAIPVRAPSKPTVALASIW